MPDRFGPSDAQTRYVQLEVYREQVVWLLIVAALLIFSPLSRFGPSYQFMTEWEGGPRAFGAVFAATAVALGVGLWRANERLMGWSLFAGGIAMWTLGVFLVIGAISAPTGVLGGAFCLYPGRHMLIHSALFTSHRRR